MIGEALHGWLAPVGWGVAGMVAISAAVSMYRVVRGPTAVDRVVGLEMVGLAAVSGFTLASLVRGYEIWLDVAIALAVVTFIGTIAVAQYMLRR